MFHRFAELGPTPCLVRATLLRYDENAALTKLVAVEQAGYVRGEDGAYTSLSLPPLALGYTGVELESTVRALDPASLAELPAGVSDKGNQWVDLDGEGIPGVLTDDGGALYYRRNLGGGALGPARRLATRPSVTALAGGGQQQLMDLGGDGRLDLIDFAPPLPGFHERIAPEGTIATTAAGSRSRRSPRAPASTGATRASASSTSTATGSTTCWWPKTTGSSGIRRWASGASARRGASRGRATTSPDRRWSSPTRRTRCSWRT
jgi:hypothetical protein